jgi:glycosyltransferase 2 family protein
MDTPSLPQKVAWPLAHAIVLGIGMLIVCDGRVPGWERAVFRFVNRLPDFLYPPLWTVQQLGGLGIVPVVAVICILMRRPRRALAVVLAGVGKLSLELVVKAIVSRQRPATSIGADIHTRGDVNLTGESFVSGHAVLAVAVAGVVIPWLPKRWRPFAWLPVGLVLFARVYVGAHNPLDVVCGAALGALIAALVNVLVNDQVTEQRPEQGGLS